MIITVRLTLWELLFLGLGRWRRRSLLSAMLGWLRVLQVCLKAWGWTQGWLSCWCCRSSGRALIRPIRVWSKVPIVMACLLRIVSQGMALIIIIVLGHKTSQ
jgi:hypothetical protein